MKIVIELTMALVIMAAATGLMILRLRIVKRQISKIERSLGAMLMIVLPSIFLSWKWNQNEAVIAIVFLMSYAILMIVALHVYEEYRNWKSRAQIAEKSERLIKDHVETSKE